MSRLTDQEYLLTEQYHDASNLNARIQLHTRFSTNKYGWHRWVFDQFRLPAQCRILELGCGPGRLWLANLPRIPQGWDITLSDFSVGMLEEARRNLGDSPRPFRFAIADAQSIPFGAERFGAIIANHMLYHVPDRQKAYTEVHRVRKRGGRFYATTNGQTHLQEMDELARRAGFPGAKMAGAQANPFRLENGLAELSAWLSNVTLRRYEDSLLVTEAAPLIAFILSTAYRSQATDEQVAELTRLVERELAEHGAILVTKDAGLFEAN